MMSRLRAPVIAVAVAAVLAAGWVVYFHNAAVRSRLPSWRWVQSAGGGLGRRTEAAAEEDEDPDNTKNEIPVHTAKGAGGTGHKDVDGVGGGGPRPARPRRAARGAHP